MQGQVRMLTPSSVGNTMIWIYGPCGLRPVPVYVYVYATRVTRGHGVVLRRIGGRGHFQLRHLRDKDGGHTIRSVMAEYALLYANCTVVSFIEPDLLPTEVLHCGNRNIAYFCEK